MTIFDIAAARISELNDADLRELVARLCEAERERQGGFRTEATRGGAQTTPDGGLDVVVSVVGPFAPSPMISHPQVGLQVKRGTMGATAVTKEMRPKGELRPFIAELAAAGGTYGIVSGFDDCSEGMLRDREDAMRDAIQGSPASEDFTVAFVDRSQLARWTSAHPSAACWAREKLGLPILRGWRPLGRWSATPLEATDDLICEEVRTAVRKSATVAAG